MKSQPLACLLVFCAGMNWAAPNLTVTASDVGKTNTQLAGFYGRQVQYSIRLDF